MEIGEIMTRDPVCCTPHTAVQNVARLMAERNCGSIPVVNNLHDLRPVGIITDRDITCRTVAKGKNPLLALAGEIMTSPVKVLEAAASVEQCCDLMEIYQIRRVPLVDAEGACIGIVAQADIARNAPEHETAELVKDISASALVA